MKRIKVISAGGTEVEINEDDWPRFESFGYKKVEAASQEPAKADKPKVKQEKANGDVQR